MRDKNGLGAGDANLARPRFVAWQSDSGRRMRQNDFIAMWSSLYVEGLWLCGSCVMEHCDSMRSQVSVSNARLTAT